MRSALYQNIETYFEVLDRPVVPASIKDNMRQSLRPYQVEAMENFIFYTTNKKYNAIENKHLLFHMATGSGKTNIIASTILYLYEQGYRDFIFFVNTTNIITKTKANLLDKYSSKYLFNERIIINNKEVFVNEIEDSFESSKADDINILFTTTHKLHNDLELTTKENSITYADFQHRKIVMIADEAHHLNSEMKKKKNKEDELNVRSWGMTSKRLLGQHAENMLLEFTATAEIGASTELAEHYADKIIYDYPLVKFRKDRYSKDIRLINSGLSQKFRVLQAIMISEYRQIVAQENNMALKPVVMFKNPKGIKNIDANFDEFVAMIETLSVANIDEVFAQSNIEAIKQLEQSLKGQKKEFVQRLRYSFDKRKCIVIYSTSADKEEILKNLNNLEDEHNQIRAIFAVNVLNEGWDVLNLFDIVKLDEAKKTGTNTTSEAQLIGRGARYYPFEYKDEEKYKRKFDKYPDEPLRILEEMYFHSVNQSDYIQKLKSELSKIGLMDKEETSRTVTLKLKQSFIEDDLYKSGVVYVNARVPIDKKETINAIGDYMGDGYKLQNIYVDNSSNELVIYDDEVQEVNYGKPTIYKLNEFDSDIVRIAINKNPFFYYSSVKKYFPNVKSIHDFITQENYLGAIEFSVRSTKYLAVTTAFKIKLVSDVLDIIEKGIKNNYREYIGTKEFYPVRISHKVAKEKSLKLKESDSKIRINEPWYVFEEHYGTSEEEHFASFIYRMMNELEKRYKDVKLIRNEKSFNIHSFDKKRDGAKFEPDFVLMLKDQDKCYHQVFIEPKGDWTRDKVDDFEQSNEKWKNDFLKDMTRLTNENKLTLAKSEKQELKLYENGCYRIYGLPFYNKELESEFKEAFESLVLDK